MTGDGFRPGDPAAPLTPGAPLCGAATGPLGRRRTTFICSRDRHDDAQHAADDGVMVLAVWADGKTPEVLGVPQWML